MGLIIPDSTVTLYAGVPICDKHQLVFSTRAKQKAYFANKKMVGRADCTYIRRTGRLRIEYNAKRVQQCDYMSFKNESFEDVTFYAKIVDYEYVNNVTTDIIYAIDYWQTYMFDAEYHSCSILREHLTKEDKEKEEENPWRRDIPELLTDEGLPCDQSLETLYNNNNQFYLSDANGLSSKTYLVISLGDCSFNDWDQNDSNELLGMWDYYDTKVPVGKPNSWDELYGRRDGGFVRPTAMVGLNINNVGNKLYRALDLLTIYGCTNEIVGMYVLPKWMLRGVFEDGTDTVSGYGGTLTPNKLNVVNNKLNTFPFHYMRVKSPKDVKEYRFDRIYNLSIGHESFNFYVNTNFNGLPVMSFAIAGYDGYVSDLRSYNFYERIDFSDFPQAAYTTDSYLTFLSGQYANAIQKNTISGKSELLNARGEAEVENIKANRYLEETSYTGVNDLIKDYVAKIGTLDLAGAYYLPVDTAYDKALDLLKSEASLQKANENLDVFNKALNSRGDLSSGVYYGTKRAYVNDEYVAGSSTGYLPYQYDALDFLVQYVTLNSDIIKKYDNYFSCYGYKSLRIGVPHVCDWIMNGTNEPYFTSFDGEVFTYIKTENMDVTGLQLNACSAIEDMFNGGVRLVKGDLS